MGRIKATYAVAKMETDGKLLVLARDLDGLDGCRKWIRAEGQPGVQFVPLALLGEPITVAVEMVRKATLGPVDAEDGEEGGR